MSLGETVELTLLVRYAGMTPNRSVSRTVHRALSGKRETWYERGDKGWVVGTRSLSPTEAEQVRMFLDSVEDGQTFTFHDGVTSHNVELDQEGYDEPPSPSKDTSVTFDFRLVEVP